MSWTLEEDDRARLARWPAPRVGGLGGRLSALALLVPEGAETVVDVGADHGQLGSGLLRAGRAQRVLAVDRSESALAGARAALAPWIQRGRARTALGDGLEPLVGAEPPWGKAACAVLAGLGGAAIAGILDRAAASGALPETVVTQPLTGHHLVRLALARQGYAARDERLDLDGRRLVATAVHVRTAEPVPAPSGPALWIGAALVARARTGAREAEHLEAWCRAQRRWLDRCPPGERRTDRARGVLEALGEADRPAE